MSARHRRVVGAATLVVIATACGHAVPARDATAPAVRSTPPTTTATRAPAAVPMVLETPIPNRPPRVTFIARSKGRTVTIAGVRYVSDFRLRDATTILIASRRVPWAAPRMVDADTALTVSLGTTAVPDVIQVRSWSQLIADGTGQPVPRSATLSECERFATPSCRLVRRGASLELRVSRQLLNSEYLGVFCSWHIPHPQHQKGPNAPDDASATWLFHVRRAAVVKASQP